MELSSKANEKNAKIYETKSISDSTFLRALKNLVKCAKVNGILKANSSENFFDKTNKFNKFSVIPTLCILKAVLSSTVKFLIVSSI